MEPDRDDDLLPSSGVWPAASGDDADLGSVAPADDGSVAADAAADHLPGSPADEVVLTPRRRNQQRAADKRLLNEFIGVLTADPVVLNAAAQLLGVGKVDLEASEGDRLKVARDFLLKIRGQDDSKKVGRAVRDLLRLDLTNPVELILDLTGVITDDPVTASTWNRALRIVNPDRGDMPSAPAKAARHLFDGLNATVPQGRRTLALAVSLLGVQI